MTDITAQDVPAVERTVRLAATGDEAAFTRLVEQHLAAATRGEHPGLRRLKDRQPSAH